MKVSLSGIDAPGIPKAHTTALDSYHQKAKSYLSGLILNKIVDIKGYGLDRNDHVLGVISLEGKNINIEMLRAGFGEVSSEKLSKKLDLRPFQEAQKEAQKAKRGLWSQDKS